VGNFSCSNDFVKRFEVTSLWPLTVMMYREVTTRCARGSLFYFIWRRCINCRRKV